MAEIQKPIPFDQLNAKPPLTARPRVSDDIQQVLALLSGFDGQQRKLVGVSQSGTLYVTSPPVKGVVNFPAVGASYDWQGDNIECSEVLVMNDPANTGKVWVNKDAAAAPDVGQPLDSGDWLRWTIKNLKELHIHIVTDTEKVILVYCY